MGGMLYDDSSGTFLPHYPLSPRPPPKKNVKLALLKKKRKKKSLSSGTTSNRLVGRRIYEKRLLVGTNKVQQQYVLCSK
jgi:hypothetical protein